MEALFLRVVWISLTCSAVLVPCWWERAGLRRHVRARALYVVWLILALRLVIPVDLSLPEPAVTVEVPSYHVVLPIRTPTSNLPTVLPTEESPIETGQPVPEATVMALTFPVNALLSTLWLFGVLAAALVQGGGYLLARRRLLRDARPDLEAEAQGRADGSQPGLEAGGPGPPEQAGPHPHGAGPPSPGAPAAGGPGGGRGGAVPRAHPFETAGSGL